MATNSDLDSMGLQIELPFERYPYPSISFTYKIAPGKEE